MKAVIPAAGQGTRLYPQTHTKPKPMVRLAGKPILGHILDAFSESPIDEVVIVVGVMRDIVVDYVETEYGDKFEIEFALQEETEGLGHCIYQTRDHFDGESMCIALGDMLFESGYDQFLAAHQSFGGIDGSIGVKRVEEPSNYGIVTTKSDGETIQKLEEKPDDPDSNLAISGVYLVDNTDLLFDALGHHIDNDIRGAGDEYQLTDALQRMLVQGADIGTFDVDDWYDCGRPETLLKANRVLLEESETGEPYVTDSSVIIPPVDIGDDVELRHSVVGPHVSIDAGAIVTDSRIRNSIVGQRSELTSVNLSEALVGNSSTIRGEPAKLNVGDSSEIHL